MYRTQKGFTLIELIVVIVLLGILGVTALGKFEDLSADAATAANSGVAAEISSAAAINYAAFIVNGGGVAMNAGNDDCSAANVAGLFQAGAFPAANHDIGTAVGSCTAVGDTYTCQVSDDDGLGTAATATIICTGP